MQDTHPAEVSTALTPADPPRRAPADPLLAAMGLLGDLPTGWAGALFTTRIHDSALVVDRVETSGVPVDALSGWWSRLALAGPSPVEILARSAREAWLLEASRLHPALAAPGGPTCQVLAPLPHREHPVGWLWLGHASARQVPALLQEHVDRHRQQLGQLLHQAHPPSLLARTTPVVCDREGRVRYHAPTARPLLARSPIRRALRLVVDAGGWPLGRSVLGIVPELVPLEGSGPATRLVRLHPTQPLPLEARHRLTQRQYQVARLAALGATNREAASALGISIETIKVHLRRCYETLGVTSRAALAGAMGPALFDGDAERLLCGNPSD
jgi:DNA-binding CsgD family transcriptional regulator